jgi:hypothetical protein
MISSISEDIPRLTNQRGKTAQSAPTNPFSLSPTSEAFEYTAERKQEEKARRRAVRKLTRVQQTDALKPTVPPLNVHGSRATSSLTVSRPEGMSDNLALKSEKAQRIADFIQQKREFSSSRWSSIGKIRRLPM